MSIKSPISFMARNFRLKFAKEANQSRDVGGAVTTDEMTLDSTGNKYYDLNVHYFNASTTSFATFATTKLMVHLFYLKSHASPSTATDYLHF